MALRFMVLHVAPNTGGNTHLKRWIRAHQKLPGNSQGYGRCRSRPPDAVAGMPACWGAARLHCHLQRWDVSEAQQWHNIPCTLLGCTRWRVALQKDPDQSMTPNGIRMSSQMEQNDPNSPFIDKLTLTGAVLRVPAVSSCLKLLVSLGMLYFDRTEAATCTRERRCTAELFCCGSEAARSASGWAARAASWAGPRADWGGGAALTTFGRAFGKGLTEANTCLIRGLAPLSC